MQTSAHTPTGSGLATDWPQAEYTGTLLHRAEARHTQPHGDSHSVPVLCMDIELETHFRTTLHVEQPFPEGNFTQCEAAAHRLKKGMRVTVQAPLVGMRLVARNATHIHTHHTDKEAA